MPSSTAFLSLTLPQLNEFFDSWHEPVNANFETIDDFLEDLHNSLVTSSATSTWAALRGSKNSLVERLDVSINADGTLDISGSADILAMSVSNTRGDYTNPRKRLDDGDEELYGARQPFPDGRFTPFGSGGPSAGFPEEQLDAGIAIRSADFGTDANHPMASPRVPWAPGLVSGGQTAFFTAPGGESVIRLTADLAPAIFNIDGYIFRLRETFDFDFSALAPGLDNYVWLYVERDDAGYNDSNFLYEGSAKDLRKLQSGAGTGTASNSTFTATGALFNSIALGKVKAGDILVIEGAGASAGQYVIESITSDTALAIRGTFYANGAGLTWHVLDQFQPNVGAVVTDGDPETQPPFVAGRVYIGRCRNKTGATPPDQIVTFTRGGVYDSGWIASVDATADFPYALTHNLGQIPSQVEIWMRSSLSAPAYRAMVERAVVTKMDSANFPDPLAADTSTAVKMLFPSVRPYCTNTELTVLLANESLDPAKGPSLFTDSGGTEVQAGFMRVIARL